MKGELETFQLDQQTSSFTAAAAARPPALQRAAARAVSPPRRAPSLRVSAAESQRMKTPARDASLERGVVVPEEYPSEIGRGGVRRCGLRARTVLALSRPRARLSVPPHSAAAAARRPSLARAAHTRCFHSSAAVSHALLPFRCFHSCAATASRPARGARVPAPARCAHTVAHRQGGLKLGNRPGFHGDDKPHIFTCVSAAVLPQPQPQPWLSAGGRDRDPDAQLSVAPEPPRGLPAARKRLYPTAATSQRRLRLGLLYFAAEISPCAPASRSSNGTLCCPRDVNRMLKLE